MLKLADIIQLCRRLFNHLDQPLLHIGTRDFPTCDKWNFVEMLPKSPEHQERIYQSHKPIRITSSVYYSTSPLNVSKYPLERLGATHIVYITHNDHGKCTPSNWNINLPHIPERLSFFHCHECPAARDKLRSNSLRRSIVWLKLYSLCENPKVLFHCIAPYNEVAAGYMILFIVLKDGVSLEHATNIVETVSGIKLSSKNAEALRNVFNSFGKAPPEVSRITRKLPSLSEH